MAASTRPVEACRHQRAYQSHMHEEQRREAHKVAYLELLTICACVQAVALVCVCVCVCVCACVRACVRVGARAFCCRR